MSFARMSSRYTLYPLFLLYDASGARHGLSAHTNPQTAASICAETGMTYRLEPRKEEEEMRVYSDRERGLIDVLYSLDAARLAAQNAR